MAGERTVRCPVCLHLFPWPDPYKSDDWHVDTGSNYEPVDPALLKNLRADRDGTRFYVWLEKAYVRCPNPFLDRDHWLPYRYGKYGDPFVIGMVGETLVGKSTLLAAMIGQLTFQDKLIDLALAPEPVDRILHSRYLRDNVVPLLQESQSIVSTVQQFDRPVQYVDALALQVPGHRNGPSRQKTVTFFDVSGEDLIHEALSTEFIRAAHGLIFVVDPENAGLVGRKRRSISDPTFDIVLSRLQASGRINPHTGLCDIAAAVVVGKADLLQDERTVAPWYGQDRVPGPLDAAKVAEESQAVYALLYANGAESWLKPVERCERATLHFASATGCPVSPDNPSVYLRGVRPRRVVEPLLAVLAMGGVLTDEYTTGGRIGI